MAKSIRSKRKRKMRAIKRERYSVKELQRLKDTVENRNAYARILEEVLINREYCEYKNERDQKKAEKMKKAAEEKHAEEQKKGEEEKQGEEQKTSEDDQGECEPMEDEADQHKQAEEDSQGECEPMDDGRRVFNKKTLKDQHGNYPVWLSSRKVKKMVKRNKKAKKTTRL